VFVTYPTGKIQGLKVSWRAVSLDGITVCQGTFFVPKNFLKKIEIIFSNLQKTCKFGF